jgi:hypothetical protein
MAREVVRPAPPHSIELRMTAKEGMGQRGKRWRVANFCELIWLSSFDSYVRQGRGS